MTINDYKNKINEFIKSGVDLVYAGDQLITDPENINHEQNTLINTTNACVLSTINIIVDIPNRISSSKENDK